MTTISLQGFLMTKTLEEIKTLAVFRTTTRVANNATQKEISESALLELKKLLIQNGFAIVKRDAIELARNTFQNYAELHQRKGTPEGVSKSAQNRKMMDLLDVELAREA
jgi:DNA polymerase elongation subunit (family B)